MTSPDTSTQIREFIFDPDDKLHLYWTGVVALAVTYNFWSVILRLTFRELREDSDLSSLFRFLNALSDAVYLVDVAVAMRTGYLEDGVMVYDLEKLKVNYTRSGRFLWDVLAIFPFELILFLLGPLMGVRIARLLKARSLRQFFNLADSQTSNPNIFRGLRLALILLTVIHWVACLYYCVSEFQGLGSTAWTYTADPSQQHFSRKYVVCFYWATVTLLTIDSSAPHTDLEYIMTGVIYLSGVLVFATVVGNVGDVIASLNAARQDFQARMDQVKMYLRLRSVPSQLQVKVKKWGEYAWTRSQILDEARILDFLPESLRAEIFIHNHLASLRKVPIFSNCEQEILCQLVLKLKNQIYSPGDYICKTGETGREMYIITNGKCEVLVTEAATERRVTVLKEGDFFGEISLLGLGGATNRRTADVRSVGYSELLCLSRRDLNLVLADYPELKESLEQHARQRLRSNHELRRALSVESEGPEEPAISESDLQEIGDLLKEVQNLQAEAGDRGGRSETRRKIRRMQTILSKATESPEHL